MNKQPIPRQDSDYLNPLIAEHAAAGRAKFTNRPEEIDAKKEVDRAAQARRDSAIAKDAETAAKLAKLEQEAREANEQKEIAIKISEARSEKADAENAVSRFQLKLQEIGQELSKKEDINKAATDNFDQTVKDESAAKDILDNATKSYIAIAVTPIAEQKAYVTAKLVTQKTKADSFLKESDFNFTKIKHELAKIELIKLEAILVIKALELEAVIKSTPLNVVAGRDRGFSYC